MREKTVLITGSTDGIGKQTAFDLAHLGYNIIVHGRNEARVNQTLNDLQKLNGKTKPDGFVCDLSSLTNIRNFANEIKSKYKSLDILINNAGVYMKKRFLTTDGFEMTFAVNHLAHFLLTNLLLDLIKTSDEGRIINVSSVAHMNATLDMENLNGEKYYDAYSVYALSKLANVLFTKELSSILIGSRVKTNALHPGVISTKLLREGFNITGDSLKNGAKTSVYLASSENVSNISGEYFVNCVVSPSHLTSSDKNLCREFWNISSEMAGL